MRKTEINIAGMLRSLTLALGAVLLTTATAQAGVIDSAQALLELRHRLHR